MNERHDIECPICIMDVSYLVETNCGHLYCAPCILDYWKHKGSSQAVLCPSCRETVNVLQLCFDHTFGTNEYRQLFIGNINDYNSKFSGKQKTTNPSDNVSTRYFQRSGSTGVFVPRNSQPISLKDACRNGCQPPSLKNGDRVVWFKEDEPECGQVKWIGKLPDASPGWMVGVEFKNPVGSGVGEYNNHKLFKAKPNHASFLPIESLIKSEEFHGQKKMADKLKNLVRLGTRNDNSHKPPKTKQKNVSFVSNDALENEQLYNSQKKTSKQSSHQQSPLKNSNTNCDPHPPTSSAYNMHNTSNLPTDAIFTTNSDPQHPLSAACNPDDTNNSSLGIIPAIDSDPQHPTFAVPNISDLPTSSTALTLAGLPLPQTVNIHFVSPEEPLLPLTVASPLFPVHLQTPYQPPWLNSVCPQKDPKDNPIIWASNDQTEVSEVLNWLSCLPHAN